MLFFRLLCEWYPAHRRLFVALAYAGTTLTTTWFACVLALAIKFTFQMEPQVLPMILCWLFAIFGAAMLYFNLKGLRKLHQSGGLAHD